MGNTLTLDQNAFISTAAAVWSRNRQAAGNDLEASQNFLVDCRNVVNRLADCLESGGHTQKAINACGLLKGFCQGARNINLNQTVAFSNDARLTGKNEIALRQEIENALRQQVTQRFNLANIGNRTSQSIRTMSIASARALAQSAQCMFNTMSASQNFAVLDGTASVVNLNQVVDVATNVLLHNRAVIDADQSLRLEIAQIAEQTFGTPAIAGIIAGSIIGLILLIVIIYFVYKYAVNKNKDRTAVIHAQVEAPG
ncbi:unnamed protein product [Rotaria magnacalcarata]|uniref:Uncharacterized protein n=1 Tax=Rotaria magnacalcarata TaxID=392030 RepID=A0A816GF83_9BILA|nr:unnamed protein product [Rotaria magnacalcarata]CAF4886695.1 unnamed protein product [Rotaria magnacalcarata]